MCSIKEPDFFSCTALKKEQTYYGNDPIQNLEKYNKIIPCGIKNKSVSNLKLIKDQNYGELNDKIINNFIKNLEI